MANGIIGSPTTPALLVRGLKGNSTEDVDIGGIRTWDVSDTHFSLMADFLGLHDLVQILEMLRRGENTILLTGNVLAPILLLSPKVEGGR